PKGASVSWLEKDNQNRLWIGTRRNGVYILNLDTQEITQPLDQGNVASIFIDSQNEIWVSTWHHGLFRYAGDQEYHYTYRPECNSIASDFIRSCCEDNQGNIWIGTIEGLNKFDKKTGLFQLFTAGQRPGDMTHSSVWQIIKDHQGTLWLGTYFGGVNFFNPEYEIYTTYDVSYNNQQSQGTLSFPIVGRMQEDRHRNLWICTEGGGLNVYDRSTGKFRWYRKKTKEAGLSHDNVKALYLDEEEDAAYIGTHLGGINKLDLKTDRFTHFYSRQGDSTSLPHNIVRDIIPAGKDSLYVATHNGVCLFSKKDGGCRQLFRHLPQGDLITMVGDLFVDSRNQLWMSVAGEGVFVYDTHTDSLRQFKYQPSGFSSISNNNINSIMEDCAGRLWFSTSGSGVDVFDPEKNTFENFDSRKNGLASDCVYEICESKDQRLLIITNKGFSQFDYLNQQFINHNKDNGFPLSTVNENALFLSSTGEVFLGGIQGMISFKEKDLDFQAKSYDILFTNLYVNGNQVKVGDDTRILPNSLLYTSQIVLDADQSIF
ncbi:MAG: two-component regulator propeller domain-containing protein, partial [Bacteroidales bacterium]